MRPNLMMQDVFMMIQFNPEHVELIPDAQSVLHLKL